MTDLSPSKNQCGILAFVSYAGKYQKWIDKMPNAIDRFNFIKNVIANMFLKGNVNS
jgi:hypothetical protein